MVLTKDNLSLILIFGQFVYVLSNISSANFLPVRNAKFVSQPYMITKAPSHLSCSAKCKSQARCNAVQYGKPNCELLEIGITNLAELTNVDGWIYIGKSENSDQ